MRFHEFTTRHNMVCENSHSVFSTDATDSPTIDEILFDQHKQQYYNEYKGWQGKVVTMSPEEYIQRCKQGFASIGEVGEVEAPRRESHKTTQYAELMRQGEKFPMPYLDYRHGFSQEGLHRAFAAIQAGIEQIPVAIIDRTPERKKQDQAAADERRRAILNKHRDQEDPEDAQWPDPEWEPESVEPDADTQRILRMLGL